MIQKGPNMTPFYNAIFTFIDHLITPFTEIVAIPPQE